MAISKKNFLISHSKDKDMDWKDVAVAKNNKIREVIDIIDRSGAQIALVVNKNDELLGTVTDGDIRRGILKGIDLDSDVEKIFNKNPYTLSSTVEYNQAIQIMRDRYIKQIPIVDDNNRVVRLELLKDYFQKRFNPNYAVIMAGGLGKRLRPLTDACPKPMLKIGGKPILEIMLNSLLKHGFNKVYISLNYKADMIYDYFGNGSKMGMDIKYVQEKEKLGTAGALTLLPEKPTSPILVINGDLLTKINFMHMLDFHLKHQSKATMGVIQYDFQVPYGVVDLNNELITRIIEKPIQKFFINAGIYILEPEIIGLVPHKEQFDMTQLFDLCIEKNVKISAFPIREYWIDIGEPRDYKKASEEINII